MDAEKLMHQNLPKLIKGQWKVWMVSDYRNWLVVNACGGVYPLSMGCDNLWRWCDNWYKVSQEHLGMYPWICCPCRVWWCGNIHRNIEFSSWLKQTSRQMVRLPIPCKQRKKSHSIQKDILQNHWSSAGEFRMAILLTWKSWALSYTGMIHRYRLRVWQLTVQEQERLMIWL